MTTKSWHTAPDSDGRLHKLWHRATNYRFLSRKGNGRQWRAMATAAWEARLPAYRLRDGTQETTISRSDVNPQLSSLFFSKLPFELRSQIYVDILGHDEFLFCVTNEDTSLNGNELGKEKIPFDFICHGAQGFLSFLMSCKLAYVKLCSLIIKWTKDNKCPGIWNRTSCCIPTIHSDSLGLQSTRVLRGLCRDKI